MLASRLLKAAVISFSCDVTAAIWRMSSSVIAHKAWSAEHRNETEETCSSQGSHIIYVAYGSRSVCERGLKRTVRCTLLLELGLTLLKQLLVMLYSVHQSLMGTCSMLQSSFPAGYVLQQRPS